MKDFEKGDRLLILHNGYKSGGKTVVGDIVTVNRFTVEGSLYFIEFTDGGKGHGNLNPFAGDSREVCFRLQIVNYEIY